MNLPIIDLPANPDPAGLGPTEVEQQVLKVLERSVTVEPTGVTRDTYLDLMERIIRAAVTWQNADGAMIDPVIKSEHGQTSPRFVSAAAILLHFGRCKELRENVYRGMDYCCRRLAGGEAASPDFWMRELMTAYLMLAKDAPADRRKQWEQYVRSIDPEKINAFVEKPDKPIESLHNWTVYGAAGEGLRELVGLGHADPTVKSGTKFWAKYMPAQLKHFTADGMYRDPGDPFTYDITTRLQFATPLAYGFKSPVDTPLHELLRRGALAELLYTSPDGFAPFGGRSASFHLQECLFAALGELEARRYRTANPKLAGAFKRHAHLGVRAIRRWLEMTPFRHLKNGFPPDQLHGCEPYGNYAVYSCFAAGCLGLAALFADESIAEAATPAEIGGYALEFMPAFHKSFLVAGGTQIEIDLVADPKYDATGLGRFHRAGVPIELGVAMPFPTKPNYKLPADVTPKEPVAIGPAWKMNGEWTSLASVDVGGSPLGSSLRTESLITWPLAMGMVKEFYKLEAGQVSITASVHPFGGKAVEAIRYIVPLLETDGDAKSTIKLDAGRAVVSYRGATLTVEFPPEAVAALGDPIANRHGIYRPLFIEQPGGGMEVKLSLAGGG
jgi:hypothetical protein